MLRRKLKRRRRRSTRGSHRTSTDFTTLEARQLFAADIGIAADALKPEFYGPEIPMVQTADPVAPEAPESAERRGGKSNMPGVKNNVKPEVTLNRAERSVTVNATRQHDHVFSEYDGEGNVRFVYSTTFMDGSEGGSGETVFDADLFDKIYFFGHEGNDYFETTTAKDVIASGGYGADVIFGGDGNDQMWGGPWSDHLEGRGGNDLLVGEDGYDLIRGNAGDDELHGGVGDDTIAGNAGEDLIVGGRGDDTLYGGSDDDTMYGFYHLDYTISNPDSVRDDDTLKGGSGNDLMYGGYHTDDMWGGTGNDIMRGGHGQDDLHGDSGNDNLKGNGGFDQLWGGTGDDRLDGGNDLIRDILRGEHGADTFVRHVNWSPWVGDDPDGFLDFDS